MANTIPAKLLRTGEDGPREETESRYQMFQRGQKRKGLRTALWPIRRSGNFHGSKSGPKGPNVDSKGLVRVYGRLGGRGSEYDYFLILFLNPFTLTPYPVILPKSYFSPFLFNSILLGYNDVTSSQMSLRIITIFFFSFELSFVS